jgi:FixJ family two-component response regulator
MPAPNGFEVLETLAREGRRLPVVLISAEHNELVRERVAERGARTLLAKPVEESVLLDAVRAALK